MSLYDDSFKMSKRVLNKNCNDNEFRDRKLTSPFGKAKQCEYKKTNKKSKERCGGY
jgi:hypothetical protein